MEDANALRTATHTAYGEQKVIDLVNEATHLREENCLSQMDVARVLGLTSHGGISHMEQHKGAPRLDKFIKILSVYGYTLKIVKK